jgi:hypothetical protein
MSTRRILLATAVVVSLTATPPAARAASPGAAAPNRRPASLWQIVTSPWQRWLAVLGLDNGCHIDPSGRSCALIRESSGLDAGCHIDPSGLCLAAPAALPPSGLDAGCHLDPNGCPR